MKSLFTLLLFTLSTISFSQKGTIKGIITDKDYNNEVTAFVYATIKGTNIGAQSNDKGVYTLSVEPGTYTVVFSFVGMKTKEFPDIKVVAGKTTTLDVAMESEASALDIVTITATKSRESKEALIEEKKNAVTITQSIGAEELSQKGVSNAEAAVTKVSGVSKQAGVKNVFVRGLGDRYNSTTLNGLPLPAEDPEYKNISLDFFSSDLIESVDINKVFNASLTGDNSGANINIDLKGLTGNKEFAIGVGTGFNAQTLGEDFKSINGAGYFGFPDSDLPVTNLASYSFDNNINADSQNNLQNLNFAVNGGYKLNLGANSLRLYGLLTADNGFRFINGTVRNTTSAGNIYLDQDFEKYQYSNSQIAQFDADYRFGTSNLEFLSLYIHKNDQEYQDFTGIDNPEQDGDRVFVNRQQVNDNNIFVNQLLGNFKINEKLSVNLKGSFNAVRSSEPDRRNFQYLLRDGFYSPNLNSGGNNQRFFSKIQENDYNVSGTVKYDFNGDDPNPETLQQYISVGSDFRYTHHVFQSTIFNHTFNTRLAVDIDNPDAIYNQQQLNAGNFRLETGRGSAINPQAFNPFYYVGDKNVITGNINYVKELSKNLLINAGLRYENLDQKVIYDTNIATSNINGPATIAENIFLPSAAIKYTLNEKNLVRASASRTYTLPRFKEIAPFRYNNPGGTATQGNPNLQISYSNNLDIAYEFYPKKGELLSFTSFYKNIENPIARTEIPSGGNTLTYLNVGKKATVIGIEAEWRKDLFSRELAVEEGELPRYNKLFLGVIGSYIYSNQKLEDPLAQFTAQETDLQGASPILVGVDINYQSFIGKNQLNVTLIGNYFSDRVYSVGTRGFENIREVGVPTLDFISSLELTSKSKISLKARNLLNPEYRLERDGINGDNIVLSQLRRGLDLSLSYTYKF